MDVNKVPKQANGFVVEEMQGESLLYRIGSHQAIHLDNAGTVIWKLCDGSRTVQEIIDLIATNYPGFEADVRTDVREVVELLERDGALLEISKPS
jgi:hypothetical protein